MAPSYSFVVTCTYFSVYISITIFLVVSFICGIKIRKEYKQQKQVQEVQHDDLKKWSKKGIIKQWAKSIWKKKKIYLQLIPHFFDQATDFGVIFEYYRLRNDEELEINTMNLFIVSIFVIILYRIISSFAIYQMTKNKRFVLLQLFDLLMIQCIWTNYQLDTDEPSNSQRYLQILEAIFESSPQILISTAFLIKAGSEVNEIVILSLITSFWTLAARVSSDDKQMYRDDWKSINFKFKCCCCNHLWFIRVVLWRFLEISSRIVLLCIVWINLGGISVFIIIGLECAYLSVICFGLGTVDMLGNVMYLMTANSSHKWEEWAVNMTKIFWAYRIISAYILLTISTIFAMIKFDASHIEDYEMRHDQTIDNQTGFALFIFCWIATPIWQWIGAVIIFDYGNLASIGRDVAQLVEDNKYLDVLELIKFGADFGAEDTLRAVMKWKKEAKEWKQKVENNIFNDRYWTKERVQLVSQRYSSIQSQILDIIAEICVDKLTEKNIVQNAFFRGCKEDQSNMVHYLIDKTDFDVNTLDKHGRSPLFYAAANHATEAVKALSEYHVNCDIIDKDGLSPIQYMLQNNTNQQENNTPASLTIMKCFIEDLSISVGAIDSNGDNIMDVALKTNQSWEIQEYLVMSGGWISTKKVYNHFEKMENAIAFILCYGMIREIHPLSHEEDKIISLCFCYAREVTEVSKKRKNSAGNATYMKYDDGSRFSWNSRYKNRLAAGDPDVHDHKPITCTICTVMQMVLMIIVDIAILVVNSENGCNKAIITNGMVGETRYSFDLNEFIVIGAVIHMVWTALMCGFQIIAMAITESERDNLFTTGRTSVIWLVIGFCSWCFFISWMVIGFILYGDMSKSSMENKQCMDIMLAWNVCRAIELVFWPCLAFCYYYTMHMIEIGNHS